MFNTFNIQICIVLKTLKLAVMGKWAKKKSSETNTDKTRPRRKPDVGYT